MKDSTPFWELQVSLIAVTLGIATWVLSKGLPRPESGLGPDLFPKVLALVLVMSGGAILLTNLRKPGLLVSINREETSRLLIVACLLLGLLASPWLLSKLGLVLTATLFTALASLFLGARWTEALLAAAVICVIGYAIFVRLLGVSG